MKKILSLVLGLMWVLPVWGALPSGYTELEYIESTGTQYIDTGVTPAQLSRNSTEIFIDGQYTELYAVNYAALFGTQSTSVWFKSDIKTNTSIGVQMGGGNTETIVNVGNALSRVKININTQNNLCYVNNSSYALRISDSVFSLSGQITLFKSNGAANNQYAKAKIYSMYIKNNGALVRNFIPVKRNSDGAVGLYDTVSSEFFENAGTGEFTAGPVVKITIATTKYVENEFDPLNTALRSAIGVVDSVVTQTINQAAAIATLQSGKQTRPDETCPAGKKCLLVEGTDGVPHWYEIFDPVHRWLETFLAVNPAGQYTSDSETLQRWQGNPDFRKTYIDGSTSVNVRLWTAATPVRRVGGMYQTLSTGDLENAGTWAMEYDGTEGAINPGVIYGIAKCTTVEQGFAQKLTSTNEAKFYELPAPVGQEDNANYPRESFKQCWCKMTAVGVPGEDGTAANGDVYPVNVSSSSWVFDYTGSSAANCASYCARSCAGYVRYDAGFRVAVLGLAD